jgi:hypothetical protein
MRRRRLTAREWAAASLCVLVVGILALGAEKDPVALADPLNQTIPTPTSVELAVTPPGSDQAGYPTPLGPPSTPGVPASEVQAPSLSEEPSSQGPASATGDARDTLAPEPAASPLTGASARMQGLYCLWVAVGLLLMAAGLGIALRRRRST